jgi:hypothetical protein
MKSLSAIRHLPELERYSYGGKEAVQITAFFKSGNTNSSRHQHAEGQCGTLQLKNTDKDTANYKGFV